MFLINRKVEIIINRHKNSERDVETSILEDSPVSPILFFMYISGVFDTVIAISLEVTSILFMDNLGFLASNNSIKKVTTSLETTEETVLKWRLSNAITYNIIKTEAILFFKACY